MATIITLDAALETARLVLFDTNVLLNAYKSADPYGRSVRDLMDRIDAGRRFTTELVLWEFLHSKDETGAEQISREEREKREKWRRQKKVSVRLKPPDKYVNTFMSLVVLPQGGANPVDSGLAAYAVASRNDPRGEFAIATADGDDFCWHGSIVVIGEFFRGPASQ